MLQSGGRRWLLSALVFTGWLHAERALAEREVWQSPTSCPAPEGLRPASDQDGKTRARAWVVVSETESGWQATIEAEYEGGRGTRTLKAASCEEIRRAALIALSLLDPAAVSRVNTAPSAPAALPAPNAASSAPPPAPQPSAPQPSAPQPSAPTATPAASGVSAVGSTPNQGADFDEPRELLLDAGKPPPVVVTPDAPPKALEVTPAVAPASSSTPGPAERRFATALGLAADFHDVALPMFGGMVDLQARAGSWLARIELGLRTTLRPRATDADVSVNLLLAGVRLQGCRSWQPGSVELGLCVGGVLQRLQGSAPALNAGEISAVWLPGASAGAKLRWASRRRVSLWAATELELRYHRVDYVVDERGGIGSFGRFNAVLAAGPEIAF